MMKTCHTCQIQKARTDFSKHNQKKDGLDPNCKSCRNARAKKQYANPPERKAKSTVEGHKICSKCNLEKSLDLFGNSKKARDGKKSACKDCLRAEYKSYYDKTPSKQVSRKKKYYEKNKKYIIKKTSEYNIERRKSDILFRIKHNLRKRITAVLLRSRWNKNNTFSKYIGCSLGDLKIHIESQFTDGMNWENYGKWEIDHITPFASATTGEEAFKLCHYTNLQPLWMSDNRSKSDKV